MDRLNALKLCREEALVLPIIVLMALLDQASGRAALVDPVSRGPIAVRITSGSSAFMVGEPASLSYSIANGGTNTVSVCVRDISFRPESAAGNGLRLCKNAELTASRISGIVDLTPGGSLDRELLIGEHVHFMRPGDFAMILAIEVAVEPISGSRYIHKSRIPVTVRIAPTDPSDLSRTLMSLSRRAKVSGVIEREQAARRLASSRHPLTIPYLEEMATNGVGRVPALAAQGLGRGQGPEFDQAIARMSGDASLRPEVRSELETAKQRRERTHSVDRRTHK